VVPSSRHLKLPSRRECDRQPNKSSHPEPTPSSSFDGDLGLVENAAPPAFTDSGGVDRDPVCEGSLALPLLPGDRNRPSKPPSISDSDRRALQRLVSHTVPQDELPSTIGMIVSNVKAADIAGCLQGSDAQTFIDVIDEVCYHAIPLEELFY